MATSVPSTQHLLSVIVVVLICRCSIRRLHSLPHLYPALYMQLVAEQHCSLHLSILKACHSPLLYHQKVLCMQTWEDWRDIDTFHLLYDWLLVLLQETLLSSQGPQADSATTAWHQLLWVAALTFLRALTSAVRLVWLTLLHFFTSGEPGQLPCVCGVDKLHELLSLCLCVLQ